MKKLRSKYIFQFAFIAIIAFTSCSEDIENEYNAEQGDIKISAYIDENSNLRATSTAFEQNDQIGIFAVPYINNNTTEGDLQDDKYASNIKTIYDESTWISETRLPWYNGNTKVNLYAYFPYSTNASTNDVKNYTYSINEDQSTIANFEASDFLWAKSEATAPTVDKVSLSFSHKMSKIRINIKTENGFVTEDIIKSIKSIKNVYIDGVVDLSNGMVTTKSSASLKDIIPYQFTNPMVGYSSTVEAIILPQTISSANDFISIKSNQISAPFIYKLTSDLTLEQGKLYTFNITIDRTGISVITDEIKDWESYTDINGSINTPALKAFDISSIDWDKTRVYKVMDNGIQVAEVVKEYLYVNNSMNAQAIVVYSMNNDGTANTSSGFVAQVMKNTSNIYNEYDPDTNPIHGGSVSWNTTNNLISAYSGGSNDIIEKIQIKDGIPQIADLEAIYILTLEPDMLTDVDNNSYGIVKIGMQYWMRENLKVEHYKTGADVEFYYLNDDSSYKSVYGGLYPWATVVDPKGITPEGWHIPTNDEFISLNNYLKTSAGAKLKAVKLWTYYYNNTNISGFSGLPGGRRLTNGTYNESKLYGQWWTSSEYNAANALRIYLDYGNTTMHFTSLAKTYSESVRCIRD